MSRFITSNFRLFVLLIYEQEQEGGTREEPKDRAKDKRRLDGNVDDVWVLSVCTWVA